MKKVIILTLALGLTLCMGTAFAAIQGSSHDIPDWSGNTNEGNGACSFCHIPHGAQGARLFPATYDTSGFTITWRDPISLMCYDCHILNASASYVAAENVNPFNAAAHQYDTVDLETWGDLTAAERAAIDTQVYQMDTTRILCVSCHNIHDNATRPFMRNNVGAGGAANLVEGNLGTLCDDCHLHRLDDAGSGERSNHPTDVSWSSTNGRAAINVFQTSVPVRYEVNWADLTEISGQPGGTGGANTHWNLGGKVLFAAGEVDEFDCATCHAVHSNETATWDEAAGGDGATTVAAFIPFPGNNLLIQDETPDPVTPADAQICLDCHDVAAVRGPGSAGASHPWAATFANGFVTVPGNGEKTLAADAITCQDCHDMHFSRLGAVTDTPSGGVGYALLRNECEDCHTATNTVANHHPVGTVTLGTDTDLAVPVIVTDYDWTTADVAADSITAVTSSTTAYYFGAAGNEMTCNTCHAGGFASAHNTLSGAFPALTGQIDESEMCVDCHGVNPSDNTATEGTTEMGSHLVGAYTNTAYYWQDSAVTPAAIDSSKQSADGTQSLICESCHTLKIDGKNSHTVAYQTADNTTASGAEGRDWTAGGAALLLTDAGNARVDAGGATGYLCTACHSATPGGGSTHPVIHGVGMAAAGATVQGGANPAGNGVSLTPGSFVNCESCHQPHDADTDGDTLILEQASLFGSGNLNETDLCAACHTDKY